MRSAGAALALLLCGCAYMPVALTPSSAARDHLEFLSEATGAGATAREQMWQQYSSSRGDAAQLRKALLQSIPGSARYNPAAAEAELRALLADTPPPEIAAVARNRIEVLNSLGECRAEADDLKKRLSKIADIERRSDKPPRRP